MIRILKYGEVSNEEIFARSVPTVNVADTVAEILKNVRERGDKALREYTAKFDHAEPENLMVTPEEMEEALAATEPAFLEILEKAAAPEVPFAGKDVESTWFEHGLVIVNHRSAPLRLDVKGTCRFSQPGPEGTLPGHSCVFVENPEA